MEKKEGTAKTAAKKNKAPKALVTSIIILAIIVILCSGGIGYFNYVNNAPLPKIDGTLKVNGLFDKVEVIRDSNGIPHIYANNVHDLTFAQGYVQAQDRWWQMDFFRHVCAGKVEELTGKKSSLVSSDI